MSEESSAPDLDAQFGPEGRVRAVAQWSLDDGGELRVVRWHLRGSALAAVRWARGQDLAEADTWHLGASLERRDIPGGRWQTIRRQDTTSADLSAAERQVNGWEAGLIARAEKLSRRR